MKKVRWGLIGCGDIAQKRVAPALRDLERCDLVAISRARAQLGEFMSDKGERIELHPPAANLHAPLIEDFVGAVVADRQPAVNGETGKMVADIEAEIYGQCARSHLRSCSSETKPIEIRQRATN